MDRRGSTTFDHWHHWCQQMQHPLLRIVNPFISTKVLPSFTLHKNYTVYMSIWSAFHNKSHRSKSIHATCMNWHVVFMSNRECTAHSLHTLGDILQKSIGHLMPSSSYNMSCPNALPWALSTESGNNLCFNFAVLNLSRLPVSDIISRHLLKLTLQQRRSWGTACPCPRCLIHGQLLTYLCVCMFPSLATAQNPLFWRRPCSLLKFILIGQISTMCFSRWYYIY